MIYSASILQVDALCCFCLLRRKRKDNNVNCIWLFRYAIVVQKSNENNTHLLLFLDLGFDEGVECHSSNCNGSSYTSLGGNLVTCFKQLYINQNVRFHEWNPNMNK